MKRLHGVVLLFASLLIFWLILNSALARDVALTMAGFVAAMAMAVAVAGGFCFLTQCRTPRAIAEMLRRISPRTWTGAGRSQMQIRRTLGKQP